MAKENNRTIFSGIRGVVARYSQRTLILFAIGNLLLAAGIVGGVWYYLAHRNPATVQLDPEDPYVKNIQRLEKEPVPAKPLDQAIYYSQLAQNYETLKQYDRALEYYFKAQEVVDKNNLKDDLAFYRAIGDVYLEKKDRREAKKYYEQELERLEEYKQRHPDDSGAAEVIKEVQQQRDSL